MPYKNLKIGVIFLLKPDPTTLANHRRECIMNAEFWQYTIYTMEDGGSLGSKIDMND